MKNDLAKVLITEEQIQRRVRELGTEIARDYADSEPIMIGILKGAVVFFSDLCRAIPIKLSMDFMSASSYRNQTIGSGEVDIRKGLSCSIEDRDVIIVEDIIDSGRTLSRLSELLSDKGARSVKICTLLDKPSRRAPGITLKVDYCGFEVPDEFVVGYGLDYAEIYRNLPYIGVLKPEMYSNG